MSSLTPKTYVMALTAEEIEKRLLAVDSLLSKDVIRQSLSNPSAGTVPSTQAVVDALSPINSTLNTLGDLSIKDSVSLDSNETSGVLPLNKGGTGGSTLQDAQHNLGILTQTEIQDLITNSIPTIQQVWLDSNQVLGVLPVTKGGTGSNSPAQALKNLGIHDSNGKVPVAQLPAVAITDTFPVSSEAAMLALTAEKGDVAIRTDINKSYILMQEPANVLANWKELLNDAEVRLTPQVRETQRRSYADAGFNLVAGSFEEGGMLVNANDVLLQEMTGKAFSGPAGVVAAGTNPTSGGFINMSNVLSITFSTVIEMQASPWLVVGQRVRWLGYYTVSDGGGSWGVVKSGTHIADGGSIFSIGPALYIEANTNGKKMTLKKFGCRQDGVTNDKDQLYRAVEFTTNNGLILDGGSLPTLVSDTAEKIFVSTTAVRIHNFNLVAGTTYFNQPRLKFDSDVYYEIINLQISGRRGSKPGVEPWRKFATFLGYDSIEPSTGNLITIGGSLLTNNVTIHNVTAKDCHYESVILGFTQGVADIKNMHFENCSNKQLHVWHGIDGGVQPSSGVTNLTGYVAMNCGILPASFTVDGVNKTRSDSVAPQGAFGCIVSFGTFNHSDVFVYNYGSTGVTPDRCITALGKNVKIWHDDPNAFSNNSSGAYWDEYCDNCHIDGIEIKISARDPRETPLENCGLQIFKQTSGVFSASNVVIETSGAAHMDKDIRGSLAAGTQVSINGYSLESNSSNTSISILQIVGASAKIELRGGRVRGAPMRITQSQNTVIESLDSDQNLVIDQSLPAAIGDVQLTGVKCADVTINGSAGDIKLTGGSVGGLNVGGSGGKLRLDGGLYISEVTYVTGLKSCVIGNIETRRRLEIVDVERAKLSGSVLKTDQPESCLTLSPSAPGIMKHVSAIGVSRWIKTGTVGAGYVSANSNVGSFSDVSPDDNTFAWT